jgi:long-chain acyl-CoA synthetase
VNLATLVDVLFDVTEKNLPNAMSHRAVGVWHQISGRQVYQQVTDIAQFLRAQGIQKGDRVAIIAENRPEWAITDFACQMLGIADVPIYPTLTAEQTQFILRDSGTRVAFVSSNEQLKKVLDVREQTDVKAVVIMDEPREQMAGVTTMSSIYKPSQPFARNAELDAIGRSVKADDLATIIYTSGTTGTPKGVMLTQENICSNINASTNTFKWSSGQGYISFLPLSHITARHVDYVMLASGIGVSYCSSFDDLPKILKEVRPRNFISVPRVYEKGRKEAERRAATGFKKKILAWALRVGRENRAEVLRGEIPSSPSWKLANALVFSKVKAGLGGRIECCISGGAPLGLDTAEWFADVGIRIFEGYGLTETSPVIAINTQDKLRLGTVGPPLPNVECKIAEDGELLVRGPSVSKGYWNLPEETDAAFEDGWFKTGDIGNIDADGFLSITDRKKDLLKTSGGKMIAPQPIENSLKNNPLIAQAAMVGDKRKFASVIIAPNFALLEDWARDEGINFSSRTELVANQKVQALFEAIVEGVNQRLAHFETLKKIILVPDEFSIATGEITPSLKLKRRVVEAKYRAQIEAIYVEAGTAPVRA